MILYQVLLHQTKIFTQVGNSPTTQTCASSVTLYLELSTFPEAKTSP